MVAYDRQKDVVFATISDDRHDIRNSKISSFSTIAKDRDEGNKRDVCECDG